ncbi:OmpA/MotB family protein [Fodinicurvata fenggangensis]|uniref:OmpA/MotB family protein n=1 Tax=Fodinicurvata fenggangensis TaxID=1121830 RepID=UPI000479586D|nr:flagellar motor protein MotB [Fodinicurvata fenggangensis]
MSRTEGKGTDKPESSPYIPFAPVPSGGMAPAAPKGGGKASGAWLVTFTDLVALLLAFFVMMFAMMTLEDRDWEALRSNFLGQVETLKEDPLVSPDQKKDVETARLRPGLNLNYLAAQLRAEFSDNRFFDTADVQRKDGRLVVVLPDDLLFESGAIEPIPRAERAIYSLGGLLARVRNRIEVVGYADPRPIEDGPHSNWELSLARAAWVAHFLKRSGYGSDIIIRGHGAGRFEELTRAAGENPAENFRQGRRTEIVVLEDAGDLE